MSWGRVTAAHGGVLAFSIAVLMLRAGQAGKITGVVTDPAEQIIPNARVTVTKDGASNPIEVRTDYYGKFRIDNLASGVFTLTLSATGFEDEQVQGVRVNDGEETRVPRIALKVINPYPNGCG